MIIPHYLIIYHTWNINGVVTWKESSEDESEMVGNMVGGGDL